MLRHACAVLLLLTTSPAAAATDFARYEIGPWPVVSRLIGCGDRLWFANSVKGVMTH